MNISEISDEKDQLEIGLKAFAGLLDEFRAGNIASQELETDTLERHLRELSARWDRKFPRFPEEKYPYASLRGICRRGVRDEYLKKIIKKLLEANATETGDRTIVNPACVFGRHARDVASRLGHFKVIATDIDARLNGTAVHF